MMTKKKKKHKRKSKRSKTSHGQSGEDTDNSKDGIVDDDAPKDLDENERALSTFFVLVFITIISCTVEKAIAGWTSAVYDHFHSLPAIKIKDGIIKYVFTCKRCITRFLCIG